MKKIIYILSLLVLGLVGCEKKIEFELIDSADKLVIEGSIENGEAPLVILTKSTGYFSKIDPALLASSFIHDARVELSNGTKTQVLKEYSYPLGVSNYNFYYYSIDTLNRPSSFF